jgi:hypothetical protein
MDTNPHECFSVAVATFGVRRLDAAFLPTANASAKHSDNKQARRGGTVRIGKIARVRTSNADVQKIMVTRISNLRSIKASQVTPQDFVYEKELHCSIRFL